MRSTKTTRASSLIYVILTVSSAALLTLLIFLSITGVLIPRKVRIGITTETLEKQYDGTALTSSSAVIKYGELIQGHRIQTQGYCEIVNIGQKENVLDFIIVDSTGADVTDMYELNVDYGTLTVLPRKISLRTDTRTKTYNGTPLTSSNISLVSGKLLSGDKITVSSAVSITEVGSISNEVPYYIESESGDDVTDHYEIKHIYGTLQVYPIALNIKTLGKTKTYDGKGVTVGGWSFIGGTSIGTDEKISVIFHEFVEAGTHKNIPDVFITDKDGKDITSRYKITFSAGTIKIDKIHLQISTGSASKIYDGTPLSKKTLSIVSGALMKGHYIKKEIFPEAINAGTTKNLATLVIYDSNGKDVSNCYDVVCNSGDLIIQPRTITISTGTSKKSYDGKPLTNNEYRLTGGSLCAGHDIGFVGSSITTIGKTQNTPTRFIVYGKSPEGQTVDVTHNYNVTYSYGTLTVTN